MPAETPTLDAIFDQYFEEEKIRPSLVRPEVVHEAILRWLVNKIEMTVENPVDDYKGMINVIEEAKDTAWKAFEEYRKSK